MNTSHDMHWDTTDDDNRPVHITLKNQERSENSGSTEKPSTPHKHVKRSPAAFAGIAIFLGIGFSLFQHSTNVTGQVQEDSIDIVISDDGVDPTIVTVRPGQTIQWQNESTIPHILRSEKLPTTDGKPFASTAIFPQGEFSYVIPLTAATGTYDYFSSTSNTVAGQITVDPSAVATTSSSVTSITTASSLSSTSLQNYPVITDSTDDMGTTTSVSSTPTPIPVDQTETLLPGSIPVNPYTVGNSPTPLPVRQNSGTPTPTKVTGSVTQHKPTSNPQTGTESWIIALMTITAIGFVAHRCKKLCAL